MPAFRTRAHAALFRRTAPARQEASNGPRAAASGQDNFYQPGCHSWEERCRAEIAASGLRLAPADRSAADLLTPQELQVALAVAAGATNREAASRLYIAPKTVEYHLRHIYDKLGTSRKELGERLSLRA